MKNEVETIKKKLIPVLKKNKVDKAGIFGSYARGEQKRNSDIDILIKIDDKEFSLLDLIALEMKLNDVLGKRVDLVEYKALHYLLKKRVLGEEIKII